ncbi:hypothetical protein AB6D60_12575 [Vibrio splendidus]
MAIFLITLQQEPVESMEQAIQKNYPDSNIKVGELAWLVEDKDAITPQSIDHKLLEKIPTLGVPMQDAPTKVEPSELGAYIISSFSGYWGYHDNSIWQWLQSRGL